MTHVKRIGCDITSREVTSSCARLIPKVDDQEAEISSHSDVAEMKVAMYDLCLAHAPNPCVQRATLSSGRHAPRMSFGFDGCRSVSTDVMNVSPQYEVLQLLVKRHFEVACMFAGRVSSLECDQNIPSNRLCKRPCGSHH
jgi:hypothetical protein